MLTDARGATVWTSLRDYPPVPAPHAVTIEMQCLRWTTRWFRATQDGAPVAPGTYTLRVRALSDDLAQVSEGVHTFELR